MPTQVQFRRGNTAQNDAFTGAVGEITYDTAAKALRLHDGSTAGGTAVGALTSLASNIIPISDNVYTLGNATNRFATLFLAGNTIVLGGLTIRDSGATIQVLDSANNIILSGNTNAGSVGSTTSNVTIGNLTVQGKLSVVGDVDTVSTQTILIADNNLVLNSTASGAPSSNASISVNRGSSANSELRYNEGADKWMFSNDGTTFYDIPFVTANLTEQTNLYYTNARVYSNIAPLLTTANVSEVTNLYFTNARSYSNVVSLLPTYTGNIGAANIGSETAGNLSIVVGAYTTTFDTLGNVSFPGNISSTAFFGTASCTTITVGSFSTTFTSAGNVNIASAVVANILVANTLTGSGTNTQIISGSYNFNFRDTGRLEIPLDISTGNIINHLGNNDVIVHASSDLRVANTSQSTSTSTGALIVYGGLGVGGNVYLANVLVQEVAYISNIRPFAANSNLIVNANVLATNYFFANGTPFSSGGGGGVTVGNDTSLNSSSFYPLMAYNTTSGSLSTANVSSTKLYFNPNSGTLNATVFNSLSDVNEKENIVKITDATNTISQLEGFEFTWATTGNKSAGVIAQYIENILPHLVDTNDNGSKSVNYSGIIAYLIETVKELDQRVKNLEDKN